jgi:hypothetical protein
MAYCQNKALAIINIKHGEFRERIASNQPPVEISLAQDASYTVIHLVGTVENGGRQPNYRTSVNYPNGKGTEEYAVSFVNCTVAIGCGADSPIDGRTFYQARITRNGVYEGVYVPLTGWYDCLIENVEFVKLCTFVVTDLRGQLYSRLFEGGCPEYTVQCNDECPEGYLKCPTTNYPGYCCIPCSEIRAELAGMRLYTSQLNNKPVGKR